MKQLLLVVLAILCVSIQGQELLTPSYSFSHRKTSYITLKDGTEVKGTLKNIDRKKGLIEEVKIKTLSGKIQKIKPENIDFMYLPPSGLDKVNKVVGFANNVTRWTDEKLDQDVLNKGYVYFENSEVRLKKGTETLLMQLLNPTNSKVVKVYHDPRSGETTGIGVSGITVTGGILKSYYFSVNGETAYRIKKKHYDAEQVAIYGKCLAKIKEEHPKLAWRDLAKHIDILSECNSEK